MQARPESAAATRRLENFEGNTAAWLETAGYRLFTRAPAAATKFRCDGCGVTRPSVNFPTVNGLTPVTFGRIAMHPMCAFCIRRVDQQFLDKYGPVANRLVRMKIDEMHRGAYARIIPWFLFPADVFDELAKTNGACALSGQAMTVGGKAQGKGMSIDRIDSEKPYMRGNIQLVTGAINMMKGRLSNAEFKNLCWMVASKLTD